MTIIMTYSLRSSITMNDRREYVINIVRKDIDEHNTHVREPDKDKEKMIYPPHNVSCGASTYLNRIMNEAFLNIMQKRVVIIFID